jgi:hypothetical protein
MLLAGVGAVVLVGHAKGGRGAFALLGVAILSLVMAPMQTAAPPLPRPLMRDAVGLRTWRGHCRHPTLTALLPAAAVGVAAVAERPR